MLNSMEDCIGLINIANLKWFGKPSGYFFGSFMWIVPFRVKFLFHRQEGIMNLQSQTRLAFYAPRELHSDLQDVVHACF